MGIELSPESGQVILAFGLYLVGVAALGYFSHRYLTRGTFVKEYFLGNRGLGPWVLALTVAATAISGGTFMGFPSLIYSKGWVMALWIASYMIVPLITMTLMGKRINQVSRIRGSVTIPDVFRDRFDSPTLGILASSLILILATVNMIAQFKGGATIMQEALDLPPLRGQFIRAEVDAKNKNVVLHFELADGEHRTQKTALPDDKAVFLSEKTQVRPAPPDTANHVLVHFRADGKEVVKRVNFPADEVKFFPMREAQKKGYVIGLLLFALTVVAYTTYGGYWAVTLTDVLLGLIMLSGVLIMAILAVQAVQPVTVSSTAVSPAALAAPAGEDVRLQGLAAATERLRQQDASLVYGPGPENYLPLGMAFSFFLMWTLMGAGQPSTMVRLMSFKDAASNRRATGLLALYMLLTYLSLLVIFICARAIFPSEYLHDAGSEALGEPDSIMPAMARRLTRDLEGGAFLGGLLLAAPYAAIMSTVAAFLLMISSSLVRDLYQRVINPDVSTRTIKRISYAATALVGALVMFGALNPPAFLQYIIVFSGTALGCSFLVPMLLTLYWRRATRQGILAGMLGGSLTVASLYVLGWIDHGTRTAAREYETAIAQADPTNRPGPERPTTAYWLKENLSWISGWGERRESAIQPLYLGGMDALIWGMLMSLVLGVGVSLITRPDEELVRKYFPQPE